MARMENQIDWNLLSTRIPKSNLMEAIFQIERDRLSKMTKN